MNRLLAYAFRSAPPADIVGFRRLVQLNGQLGDITAACFLLYHPEDRQEMRLVDVHWFLTRTVPRLLPQLSRTTQPQRVQLHGRISGRIDWESTYKARYSEEGNPAIFVCQQSGRRYDRPENQVLKFLLHQIQACLDQVSPEVRSWHIWAPSPDGQTRERVPVGRELALLAHRLRRYQASAYLRGVALPTSIGGDQLAAVRTAKNQLYAEVYNLLTLYTDVAEALNWSMWVRALNQTAPLPATGEAARLLLSTT